MTDPLVAASESLVKKVDMTELKNCYVHTVAEALSYFWILTERSSLCRERGGGYGYGTLSISVENASGTVGHKTRAIGIGSTGVFTTRTDIAD